MSGAACAKEILCFPPARLAAGDDHGKIARVEGFHAFTANLIAGNYTMTADQERAYKEAVNCYAYPGKFAKAFAELAKLL